MANQGLLAQLKPTANTDTVLYRAPIDKSASTVLTIANDGTGSAYDVALKDCDQKLTLDAATYKLHKGDLISSYFITLNTNLTNNTAITVGDSINTTDAEKTFKFESFCLQYKGLMLPACIPHSSYCLQKSTTIKTLHYRIR